MLFIRRLLFVLLLFFLCSCAQKIEDSAVGKFEDVLGQKETRILNDIVADFEHYLSSEYPNEKSAFPVFLRELSTNKIKNGWKIDSIQISEYKESNLFPVFDTVFPDSVWYDGVSFSLKYPKSDYTEEIIPIEKRNSKQYIDSMLGSLKNTPDFLLIRNSSFIAALDSVQHSDSLVYRYLDAKQIAGYLGKSVLANGLLGTLDDDNEYFAKRIFVMDNMISSD